MAVNKVYLDTNPIIYLVEGDPGLSETLSRLFDLLRSKPGLAVTSELTLAEVLAPTSKRGQIPSHLKRSFLNLLVWSRFISLIPVSRDILYGTADVRLMKKMHLPDAVHLVTAIRNDCRFFFARDSGIPMPAGMTRVAPDAEGVSLLIDALK